MNTRTEKSVRVEKPVVHETDVPLAGNGQNGTEGPGPCTKRTDGRHRVVSEAEPIQAGLDYGAEGLDYGADGLDYRVEGIKNLWVQIGKEKRGGSVRTVQA